MKVQILFAWYDIWIGAFYDKKKNWWYILPLPTLGIILKLPENWRISIVVERLNDRIAAWRNRKELARKRTMNAKQLQAEHDPMKFGEYSNDAYLDMLIYAQGLEKEIKELKKAESGHISDVRISSVDVRGKKPKAGDRIRIYHNYYTVIESPVDGELWACPDADSKLLNNWSKRFEILD